MTYLLGLIAANNVDLIELRVVISRVTYFAIGFLDALRNA
jgi:hypothetical protein